MIGKRTSIFVWAFAVLALCFVAVLPSVVYASDGGASDGAASTEQAADEAAPTEEAADAAQGASGASDEIMEEMIPLERVGSWALINLIFSFAAVAVAAVLLIRSRELASVVAGLAAIIAVILFFRTEDLAQAMRLTDSYTVFHVLILALQIMAIVFARRTMGEDDDEFVV